MVSTAIALFGFALGLVAVARQGTINRRRGAVFAGTVMVTAAANIAVLLRVEDRTAQVIGLLTSAALLGAIQHWASLRTRR